MKKIIISTIVILLMSNNVMALDVNPIVNYSDGGRGFYYANPNSMNPPQEKYYDILNRPSIFKNESELHKSTERAFGDFVKIVQRDLPNKYSKKYSMISIMPFPDRRGVKLNLQKKQVSIFVKSEIIGYYVLSPVFVQLPDSDSTYIKMKSLPLNPNYLLGKYTIPENTQLKVYEKEHSGYIERYITFVMFVNGVKEEYLFAELFYPKEIDGEFDSKIIDAINTYAYRIDKITKSELGLIPFDDIVSEFSNPLGNTEY